MRSVPFSTIYARPNQRLSPDGVTPLKRSALSNSFKTEQAFFAVPFGQSSFFFTSPRLRSFGYDFGMLELSGSTMACTFGAAGRATDADADAEADADAGDAWFWHAATRENSPKMKGRTFIG